MNSTLLLRDALSTELPTLLQAVRQGPSSPAIVCAYVTLERSFGTLVTLVRFYFVDSYESPPSSRKESFSSEDKCSKTVQSVACSVNLCLGLPGSQLHFWALFLYMN